MSDYKQVALPEELHREIRAAAANAGCSIKDFVIAAIRRQLAIEQRVIETLRRTSGMVPHA